MISCLPLLALLHASPQAQTEIVNESPSIAGAGGRVSWILQPMEGPKTWIDLHGLVRPLPRLFLAGGWARSESSRRGNGPDTTAEEMRWDVTAGLVLLQGAADFYLPAVWRHCSQNHSWLGQAKWSEIGTGVGALADLRGNFGLRTEVLWMSPTQAHPDLSLGPGRESDGSHLELSLGFLVYLR